MTFLGALRSLRRAGGMLRYTTAIGLLVVAVSVAIGMDVGLHGQSTAPVFAAVLAAAWLVGFGPAIVTAALGVIALDRMRETPGTLWHFDVRDVSWMVLSFAIVLGTAWLASAIRQLEDERMRLLAREHEARMATQADSRAKDDFLAIVSHELRNPLSGILGWVEVLKTATVSPPEAARAVDVIDRNMRLQAKLIDELLDVSRAVAGKLDVVMYPIDLADIVRRATQSVEPAATAAAVTIEMTTDAGLSLLGDPTRLEQVVVNLAANAIKFTPPGGRVYVEAHRRRRDVELVVRDTGQGIDPATVPHIFELFRQGRSSGTHRREGLGLGLAIVQHIVERHGGSIEASSPGRGLGATFIVRLPADGRPGGYVATGVPVT